MYEYDYKDRDGRMNKRILIVISSAQLIDDDNDADVDDDDDDIHIKCT